ncbi:MAG: PAS domain-containing sensor histidine kinase [Candidatus Kapabacteria bacterium]|nr:PAS domain-containing sensor histidine kinase [Candidatus Kapabacteria bacterium]
MKTENMTYEELLKYKLALDSSSESIFITAPNGIITYINPAFTDLYGYTPDEIVGKHTPIILKGEKSSKLYKKFWKNIVEGMADKSEYMNKTKDGKILIIESTTNPFLNEENQCLGFICVQRDVTDRKDRDEEYSYLISELTVSRDMIETNLFQTNELIEQLSETQEALEKTNSEKDNFFSIIAHDLKNPLGNFRNVTELLSDSYADFSEKDRIEFIGLMNDSAKNIYALLENLLEWSRSQRGQIPFQPLLFNLKMMSIDIFKLMKPSADAKNIELINHIPVNYEINADLNMINTVIRNLISNAIKFTPNGGMIELGLKNINDNKIMTEECIYIRDNGLGMNKEMCNKLFRIDTNVTTPGTNAEKGTGLGLILCKEFIEKHGGKIWVESEEGKGSTFYFTIPKSIK